MSMRSQKNCLVRVGGRWTSADTKDINELVSLAPRHEQEKRQEQSIEEQHNKGKEDETPGDEARRGRENRTERNKNTRERKDPKIRPTITNPLSEWECSFHNSLAPSIHSATRTTHHNTRPTTQGLPPETLRHHTNLLQYADIPQECTMRLTSTQVSALFAASTLAGVSAFNALPTTSKPMRPTHSAGAAIPTSTTSLHVGMTLNMPPSREDGEFDGSDPFMVTQMAQDCADSDTCSVEDAEKYLRGLLMIQSDCAANILDEENAICRDVGTAAALVAALRDKIKFGQAELARQTNFNTVASFGLGAAALLFASTLAVSVLSAQPDAAPFTMQEWWWAARDGYLGTMMAHFVRHGGLVAAEAVDGTQSNSNNPLLMTLTLREWVWAIQGGYFDNMVVQLFREGGMELASAASSAPASAISPSSSLLQETASAASSLDGVLVANLTPQEVWWAIRGSYVDTLLSHVYHNGGLAVTDYDSDAVSFSIEEWKHAMRDGYMDDMVASFYTKGGL